VLLVAAAAILGGVVLAALGRAGEMATFAGDTAPIELDEVSATDVALLRPPMSLWGYNAQATEDALRVIARSVTARDVEIATLRRELADLQGRQDGARPAGARDRPAVPAGPTAPAPPPAPAGPRAPVTPARPSAGQPRRADQPAPPAGEEHRADASWLPAWQRPSGPGTDE